MIYNDNSNDNIGGIFKGLKTSSRHFFFFFNL